MSDHGGAAAAPTTSVPSPGGPRGGGGRLRERDRDRGPAGALGAEADWQVREWVGKAGAGPGAAGGCSPASPPPPRDYLVPAAAMSPGRNVPPQIMLFISLGGSAARQHQAPGGRCARSPALPSSPCAAAAAAPGLRLAAATAPAQVSPGRGPGGPRGVGVGADARGWGARRERRGGAGPRGPRRGGPIPGAGSEGGAGPGRPWRLRQRTPRGAGIRVGFGGAGQAGRLLWRTRSWSVARGRWEGGEVLRVLVLGRLFQYPSMRAKGVLSFASRSSALPSLPSAAVFLSLGAAQILFWGTWPCAPGAVQRPGRDGGGVGPHPAGAGNHAERVARCTQREKVRAREAIL